MTTALGFARTGLGLYTWLVALLASLRLVAAEQTGAAPRLTVAVLTFENKTGDPQAGFWCYALERLLGEQLAQTRTLRRVPVKHAYPQLKIDRGSAISPEQARSMGELVEARRVIWGSYQRQDGKWQVTARVLNVANGKVSQEITAAAADWYEVRDKLGEQLCAELDVKPTERELRTMRQRGTSSPQALEWYCRADAAQQQRKPKPELEASIRKALAADPQFAEASAALAAVLGSQGLSDAAEKAARQGLKLKPDSARLHQVLGLALMFRDQDTAAQKELEEAFRLEPDDHETLSRMGELAQKQGRLDEAIARWNEAKALDRTDGVICAHLGTAYARKRDRDKALRELKEAERLGQGDVNTQQVLWQGYAALHEIPLAVEHLQQFVALSRKEALSPKVVTQIEDIGNELKARLTPHEIAIAPPRDYTPEALQAALKARLTAEEVRQVVNPIASTAAMNRWAEELTRGATNDVGKARSIFEALARHLDTGEAGIRTAQEVFAAWNDPAQSFCCQEYARLYIALARAVGLRAYYVHLEKDYSGDIVYHDCAVVFFKDKALLVDPAYQWFGPPHKEYVVLDDLQSIAHRYYQHSGEGSEVARCRLAAKLHPDTAWGQLHLAGALIKAREFVEAGKTLRLARQLGPDRWDYYTYAGFLAGSTGDLAGAVTAFHKALELNSKHGPTHLLLAWVLSQQGRLEAARNELRLAVLYGDMLSIEEKTGALRAIAEINERLPEESGNRDSARQSSN